MSILCSKYRVSILLLLLLYLPFISAAYTCFLFSIPVAVGESKMEGSVTLDLDPDLQGYTEGTHLIVATDVPVLLDGSTITHDLKDVQAIFNVNGFIFTPTLLIVGIFGHCMTILTMSSKSFSDTTCLMLQQFNNMIIIKLFGFDVRAVSSTHRLDHLKTWFAVVISFIYT